MALGSGSSDKNIDPKSGKALTPAEPGPVNPFLAAGASERVAEAEPTRGHMSRLLDYSAHAAIAVGIVGLAWTVGSHFVDRSKAKPETPAAAVATQTPDELAQLRLSNQKMHDEIRALKASIDTLRSTVRRDTTPEQVRMLTASLDTIKGSVSATNETIAQLNSKVDKLQPAKLQQLSERLNRLERQAIDTGATASIPKSEAARETAKSEPSRTEPSAKDARAIPEPPAKPTKLASAEATPASGTEADKPQVIAGWVVRDVYQGVALIEGKRGRMEVAPGDAIPGAGVVKTIERHGTGWTVTTTKGQFASAATPATREVRRGFYPGGYARGPYAPYRDDY